MRSAVGQISNVDRAILELMATRSWPPHTVDMYGDVYSGCMNGRHTDFLLDSEPYYVEAQQQSQQVQG